MALFRLDECSSQRIKRAWTSKFLSTFKYPLVCYPLVSDEDRAGCERGKWHLHGLVRAKELEELTGMESLLVI